MQELRDKVAVITGAGAGLGAAIAQAVSAEGMRVVVADIETDHAEHVAQEIRDVGGDAQATRVDVGAPPSLSQLAKFAEQTYGACHLLCANVGVQRLGHVDALDADDWEWLIRVNVLGTVNTVRSLLPLMRKQPGEKHIVLTSSISGLLAAPRLAAYTASKYAVTGYGETLRLELADDGIGVTLLFPGGMATTPLASSASARPAELGRSPELDLDDAAAIAAVLSPTAESVVEPSYAIRHLVAAIRENRPYLVTHAPNATEVKERFGQLEAALSRADD